MGIKFLSAAIAAFVLAGANPAAAVAPVARDYTFEWVGNCEDCAVAAGTETYEVRARLQLDDYVAGTYFYRTEGFRFDYFGSNLADPYSSSPFTMPNRGLNQDGAQNFVSGSIDSSGQLFDVYIQTYFDVFDISRQIGQNIFYTDISGGFKLFYNYNSIPDDYGTGTWNPVTTGVPEPDSWALLILGFGLLGTTMRQRRKAAA